MTARQLLVILALLTPALIVAGLTLAIYGGTP